MLFPLGCHGQGMSASPIQPDPEHCQGWGVCDSLSKDKKLFPREFVREELMPRDVQ